MCATTRRSPRPAIAPGALLVVVVTEAVSLGLVKPPGEMGADIVAAEGQSIGNRARTSAARMSASSRRARNSCGRCRAGSPAQTVDAEGRRGCVLTLSTREQHIRREKATSNICTNSGLCALAFTIHMALLGEAGLHAARRAQPRAGRAARRAPRRECRASTVVNDTFFNEFTLRLPRAGRAGGRGAGRARHARRRAGEPLLAERPGHGRSADRRRDRDQHRGRHGRFAAGAARGAAMSDWSQALGGFAPRSRRGRHDRRQSRPADRRAAALRAGRARPLRRRSARRRRRSPTGSAALRRARADRPAGPQRAAGGAPFHAALAEELRASTPGSIRSARAR